MEEESGADIYEMLAKIVVRSDDEDDCAVIMSIAIELRMNDCLSRDSIASLLDIALKSK